MRCGHHHHRIALTAGNIAGLLVIGREFPKNINAMTGLYVSGMSCGSMLTMALTAPLSHNVGWRMALSMPALLAVGAIFLFAATFSYGQHTKNKTTAAHPLKKAAGPVADQAASVSGSVFRRPLVWLLSAAFAAHTFLFYGLTAWMTVYLIHSLKITVSSAGVIASIFQILGLLGCFGIPLLARMHRFNNRGLFLVVTLSWLATVVGFWVAPSLWILWIIFGGIGSGGGFTVIFSIIMHVAKDLDENRAMSTVVQSTGYIVASIAPFAIGHLHEVAGNWQGSMELLTGASVVMAVCGLAATGKGKS